jgi:hypothetical protein
MSATHNKNNKDAGKCNDASNNKFIRNSRVTSSSHNRYQEQQRYQQPVLRIRDVYPGSRISDPGSKNSNKRER